MSDNKNCIENRNEDTCKGNVSQHKATAGLWVMVYSLPSFPLYQVNLSMALNKLNELQLCPVNLNTG